MVASAIFLTDLSGKPLITRNYRGDIPLTSAIEKFTQYLLEVEEENKKPVFYGGSAGGETFVYVQHNNLYLCAVTCKNSNVALVLTYLYQLTSLFQDYFTTLNEESIRDNFVIIYELLDETMDHGLPQSLDSTILRQFITQEGNRMADDSKNKPPVALTNAVSWRAEGIKHKKNEIFLDVVEKLNLLVAANGTVLHSEINGAVKMKSFLSGMPELKLGLNDKVMFEATGRANQNRSGKSVELEDIKFHQCVRLARFENDRTISFIPPDGEFDLMTYRLDTHVKPLIWVEAVVEPHRGSRIEYMIKTRSQFKSRSVANNVEISIPVPPDVDSPSFKSSVGNVTYLPDKDCVVWTIKQFHGGREYLMRAHFGLPSISREEADGKERSGAMDTSWKKPIGIKFEIPYFTVSGIQVRYLKIIEKSGYQALPWVRYITANGDYQLRMA
ncbi:mu subunit of tetrameric clathrin adaptor complex AP1 [Thalassiosira pseudonana CCMP1335]|uniref:Mu subunit of tetrameric clathrin adaptor complex AP1 n=1 Tax=Thalassiosira pseudonana TaxID=35128 RepID=B8CCW2_THAPS|nr:mu subunit of tetrameric clathrin adaptor complex AP1 [Thalassiosira pseudonana CCMP1335]EED88845.1 mu subunit of tetrameric clathrin adaptor complex AP1 [Thalassiosira pseudonana CCMP1335]